MSVTAMEHFTENSKALQSWFQHQKVGDTCSTPSKWLQISLTIWIDSHLSSTFWYILVPATYENGLILQDFFLDTTNLGKCFIFAGRSPLPYFAPWLPLKFPRKHFHNKSLLLQSLTQNYFMETKIQLHESTLNKLYCNFALILPYLMNFTSINSLEIF